VIVHVGRDTFGGPLYSWNLITLFDAFGATAFEEVDFFDFDADRVSPRLMLVELTKLVAEAGDLEDDASLSLLSVAFLDASRIKLCDISR
jgi:hypothetical protein